MNRIVKWTALVLFGALLGLALAFAVFYAAKPSWASPLPRQVSVKVPPSAPRAGTTVGAVQPTAEPTPNAPPSPWGYGRGLDPWGSAGGMTQAPAPWAGVGGNSGWRMMGTGMHGAWSGWDPVSAATVPISMDQAIEAARRYVSAYGNSDLALSEVMEFSDNFYADIIEQSTGIHAFELLIDHYTGRVSPEIGPNMMWNVKYGPMGGWWNASTDAMTATPQQALDLAQAWLDANLPGTSVADAAEPFYGYYTIHVLTNGQISGMLSVNGYTGQVWFHAWHGTYIGMQSLEEKPTD